MDESFAVFFARSPLRFNPTPSKSPPPPKSAERCRSGRTGRSRKPLSLQGFRGFESHPLRHFSKAALENSRLGKDGLTFSIPKRDPIQPLQEHPNRLGELPVAAMICDRRNQGCALFPPVVVAVTRVAPAPWGHLWKSEPRCAQSRLWRRVLNRGSTAFSRIFGGTAFRQGQQGRPDTALPEPNTPHRRRQCPH